MIDLDLDTRALTYPVLAKYSGGHFRGRYVPCISQPLAQARVVVFEAGGCYVLRWSCAPLRLVGPK
jgi:hypothetical protein